MSGVLKTDSILSPFIGRIILFYQNSGELLLFGGEYYDGDETTVYNGVFRWNIERGGFGYLRCYGCYY